MLHELVYLFLLITLLLIKTLWLQYFDENKSLEIEQVEHGPHSNNRKYYCEIVPINSASLIPHTLFYYSYYHTVLK